ncbi:MAG: DUF192 domain-containing protein [Hyphomicrobiales bacterium]|nr:MAG: DUF192 domain-containing protein [Hyphomicrobiales bacterium]
MAARMAFALVALAVLSACSGAGGTASEDRAVLHTASGDYAFSIEIADDREERAKGLMFRTELKPDAGMLFDYGTEQLTSFWMQNTLIPLDMIFIGADGVVKNIHVNARPLDTTSIPSGVPVRFVLEIPGGRSPEIGLKVGDRMDHPRVVKP